MHTSILKSRLLLSPEARGGARAKQHPYEAAEETTGNQRGPDESQLECLEAFLAGAHEEDDAADGGGAQADVKQGIGGGALVVYAEEVVFFGAFAKG